LTRLLSELDDHVSFTPALWNWEHRGIQGGVAFDAIEVMHEGFESQVYPRFLLRREDASDQPTLRAGFACSQLLRAFSSLQDQLRLRVNKELRWGLLHWIDQALVAFSICNQTLGAAELLHEHWLPLEKDLFQSLTEHERKHINSICFQLERRLVKNY